jgi:serine/threonine protein kinase
MDNLNNTIMYNGPRYRPERVIDRLSHDRQSHDLIELVGKIETIYGQNSGEIERKAIENALGIKFVRVLGEGAQATVYAARYCEPRGGVTAVRRIIEKKEFSPSDRIMIEESLLHQQDIMRELIHAGAYVINSFGTYSIDLQDEKNSRILQLNELFGDGTTLCDLIGNNPDNNRKVGTPVDPSIVKKYITSLIHTTMLCEDKEIIHSDLKPANILLDPKKGIKLADFGIAYRLNSEFDPSSNQVDKVTIKGTPGYMSFSNFTGKPHDTDRHAIAVIAYEMLTGKRPFDGDSIITIASKKKDLIYGETVPLTGYEGWDNWLRIALKPRNSYPNAQEMSGELEEHISIDEVKEKERRVWPVAYARDFTLPKTVILKRDGALLRHFADTKEMVRSI